MLLLLDSLCEQHRVVTSLLTACVFPSIRYYYSEWFIGYNNDETSMKLLRDSTVSSSQLGLEIIGVRITLSNYYFGYR
ncbi:Dual oxidase maturation factor 1 [Gossypium arboreum]|uniref:Dual oxidase maturation factor 1 n=1 Tax=Gossypium arboreum TaxID=29729 RepID=A0A0B0P903_GOSAR|nr:Dual oxidase maturation factor 1 [Gossypium arboreum]